PVLKAFVRGEHGRGVLVTTSHELEEEHGAGAADRQVADLVNDEQCWMREYLEPLVESAGSLGFLERADQVGEGAVVDAASALCGGDRKADREMRFPDSRRAEKDHILLPLHEAELVQAFDLLAANRRLEREVGRSHGHGVGGATLSARGA